MDIKTKLLEDYVNFVENTKRQNKYFKTILISLAIILSLFSFFLLFKYKTK